MSNLILSSAVYLRILSAISLGANYPTDLAKAIRKSRQILYKQIEILKREKYITETKLADKNKTVYSINYPKIVESWIKFLEEIWTKGCIGFIKNLTRRDVINNPYLHKWIEEALRGAYKSEHKTALDVYKKSDKSKHITSTLRDFFMETIIFSDLENKFTSGKLRKRFEELTAKQKEDKDYLVWTGFLHLLGMAKDQLQQESIVWSSKLETEYFIFNNLKKKYEELELNLEKGGT